MIDSTQNRYPNHPLQRVLDRIHPSYYQWVDCGSGWNNLILSLHDRLAEIDPDFVILQVKQKFGGLRFYYEPSQQSSNAALMATLVRDAERISYTICEETGKPGTLMRRQGMYQTLSEDVADETWERIGHGRV